MTPKPKKIDSKIFYWPDTGPVECKLDATGMIVEATTVEALSAVLPGIGETVAASWVWQHTP